MIAFWIAVVVGLTVGVVYVALAVEAFLRVRRDILSGVRADVFAEAPQDDESQTFTWKTLGAVIFSVVVIVSLGVDSTFWYLPAVLAIGTAAAVITAFHIDRKVP